MKRHTIKNMTIDDIAVAIEYCKQYFNQACNCNIFTEDNLKVSIFAPENIVSAYETFCQQYFPIICLDATMTTLKNCM